MKVERIEIIDDKQRMRQVVRLHGQQDGGWSGFQNFCYVYEVGGFLVGANSLSDRPMFVVQSQEELLRMVKTMTGAE